MDTLALPPTNQKRMVAFINHFIVSTVTFLNKFAADCESRFVQYEHKMQNLEASLMIVEAKLASIDVLKQQNNTAVVTTTADDQKQAPSPVVADGATKAAEECEPNPSSAAAALPERDPKYDLYFKMLHLGVQLGAVKNKIASEGLDPDYIDRFL
uniref:Coiled-coil domain-containing protein 53 n=1 Tax=Anopheles dirus TaxID=7168 RepID=A0A182NLW3_9DIPT